MQIVNLFPFRNNMSSKFAVIVFQRFVICDQFMIQAIDEIEGHTQKCLTVNLETFKRYCSAWSKLQVPSERFGLKRNSKMPFDHHPPTTANFWDGSRPRRGSYLICRPILR